MGSTPTSAANLMRGCCNGSDSDLHSDRRGSIPLPRTSLWPRKKKPVGTAESHKTNANVALNIAENAAKRSAICAFVVRVALPTTKLLNGPSPNHGRNSESNWSTAMVEG